MVTRTGKAEWHGDLKSGNGVIRFGDGRFEQTYSAGSRFENEPQTNPEELIAAAHAACYSMALSNMLAEDGHAPREVKTEAAVNLDQPNGEPAITTITLTVHAKAEGVNRQRFAELATSAKDNCPVSKALAGCKIDMDARLMD